MSRELAQVWAQALAEAGVERIFGVPGGGPNLDMIGAAAPPSRPTPLSSGLDSVTSSMNAATADASGPTPLLVLDEDSGPVGQPRSARITRPPISSAAIAVPPAAPVAPTAHEDSSPITRGESS